MKKKTGNLFGGEEEIDFFDQAARTIAKQIARPRSLDEYEDYISQEPYDIGKMSALTWWTQEAQKSRWPRLSFMAIDVLSMPAMSDEAERVFSGARRTITWDRAQMAPDMIEYRECLKNWKKSGILDVY